MDELSLICHMAGEGEALAQKLRGKGFGDLKKISSLKVGDLAKELSLNEDIAYKILSAANSMLKPKAKITAAKSKKETLLDKLTNARGQPLIKKYWKKVLPILAFTLFGYWLGRRN